MYVLPRQKINMTQPIDCKICFLAFKETSVYCIKVIIFILLSANIVYDLFANCFVDLFLRLFLKKKLYYFMKKWKMREWHCSVDSINKKAIASFIKKQWP